MRTSGFRLSVPMVGCLLCAVASAQVTQRVSVASSGVQGYGDSGFTSLSADGRFVAFASQAQNLASNDTNGFVDVFVRDRRSGRTELVSIAANQAGGNANSSFGVSPSISADGRFVAFISYASNLVAGDTNGKLDAFVRDLRNLITVRVSVSTSGTQGNGHCRSVSISADGRYVAFDSESSNLAPGDWNAREDVFVRDLQGGITQLVSAYVNGEPGLGASWSPSISADGRFVAFTSDSPLVQSDTNGFADVYVHDRSSGLNERASLATGGAQENYESGGPRISADGRYVAFISYASNLVEGDTNGSMDVFVRDRQNDTTERVSMATGGVQGNGDSGQWGTSISGDGRRVAFASNASNLVAGDTNRFFDVFVRDRLSRTTDRVSVATSGREGNGDSGWASSLSISADGHIVAFGSVASNLVAGDTNVHMDVFVHDRDAISFTSLCDPGIGTVIDCPCWNWPTDTSRGCNNSSWTGGASLMASGVAHLSTDSLVFTTDGEKPTAFSIVMQGNTLLTNGVIDGQGVRCAGGMTKRLFVKTAVAGSITAPDFGAGDSTVSARSAAKGDVIQPGQSRYYLVYYRDPIVLGGCPASSTFNATQTGQVTWWQ